MRAPPRGPKRERCLITQEGWILVQDDPLEHAVPLLMVTVGDHVCRFRYENTVTVAGPHERPLILSTYVEEEGGDGDGNGTDPLEDE
jgi:hypothetical protein